MQRLFSSFPSGWPGVGLLLLRFVSGFTLLLQGIAYALNWHYMRLDALVIAVLAFLTGVCFLAGIFTPVVSVLVMLGTLVFALSWVPAPATNLFESKLVVLYVMAIAIAIAFLGPGAFSFDARLFGRREIFIPANTSSQKS